ncbi:MAG: hypothetical protein HRU19_01930 [Pseudobacteriovorax sp.]|nr:hypothetical protein [Pseudobacteriovorax sp.]
MTIENLQKSFASHKAKFASSGGANKRIRYPKELKAKAIQHYRNNPDLSPQRMAKLIGISTSAGDKWFRGIKQRSDQSLHQVEPLPKEPFVELKPKSATYQTSKLPEITVKVTEIKIPADASETQLQSLLNAIISGGR